MQVWRWALTCGSRTVASSTPVRFLVSDRAPRASARVLMGEARSGVLAMMAPQEIDDEEYEQVPGAGGRGGRGQGDRDGAHPGAASVPAGKAADQGMAGGRLSEYLETCRELLRTPAYRGSSTARQLDQQLAAFSGASAARALPGGR